MTAELKASKNVEMTAVCDLWTGNLERAIEPNGRLGQHTAAAFH